MTGKRKRKREDRARAKRIRDGAFTREHLKGVHWATDAIRLAAGGMSSEKIAKRLGVPAREVRKVLLIVAESEGAVTRAQIKTPLPMRKRPQARPAPPRRDPPLPEVDTHAGIHGWRDVLALQRELLRLRTSGHLKTPATKTIAGELTPLLTDAVPVFLGPEVADLWRRLRRRAKPKPLRHTELLVPIGFIGMSTPEVLWPDGPPIRGLGWVAHEQRPGVHVAAFTYAPDLGPECRPNWAVPWMGYIGFHLAASNGPAAHVTGAFVSLLGLALSLIQADQRAPRKEGLRVGPPEAEEAEDTEPVEREAIVIRLRRLERPKREPDTASNGAPHEPPEWTCRWTVREHFRELPDGRAVLVRGHIKGPEGLPLRNIQRAIEVVR